MRRRMMTNKVLSPADVIALYREATKKHDEYEAWQSCVLLIDELTDHTCPHKISEMIASRLMDKPASRAYMRHILNKFESETHTFDNTPVITEVKQ
jgi:hypothetical protein